jgi:hypothetical protein
MPLTAIAVTLFPSLLTFETFLYFVVLGSIFAYPDIYRLSYFDGFYTTSEERVIVVIGLNVIEVSAKGRSFD